MNAEKKHLVTVSLFVGILLVGLIAVSGCKKSEPEPTPPPEPAPPAEPAATVEKVTEPVVPTAVKAAEETVSQAVAAIEQTTCPVMAGPINKELYTEYKGKKVYFCCAGCKEKFEQSPEQYLAKLPQFSK